MVSIAQECLARWQSYGGRSLLHSHRQARVQVSSSSTSLSRSRRYIRIAHLSLRFSQLDDTGAERLAHALGNLRVLNCTLLTLTLTGNQIGDVGANAFATVRSAC